MMIFLAAVDNGFDADEDEDFVLDESNDAIVPPRWSTSPPPSLFHNPLPSSKPASTTFNYWDEDEFEGVPQHSTSETLEITVTVVYNKDTSPLKLNLGVGAYRTEEGKPLVLNVVRRAEQMLAETLEDLYEWKTALEHALAQAPSVMLVMEHNGNLGVTLVIQLNDPSINVDSGRNKHPVKSLVVGRQILLALEDIDGGPSFLEKALRFLEKHVDQATSFIVHQSCFFPMTIMEPILTSGP
ncbi:unnamed protein product [Fraxinus pennsylvanica]|uniref:Aspartate transaminase n=1 Tax=Fraxinus pennsylvanica TaxID=56036 RepID=A0AAD2E9R6_9LAMI|nr:unnamed protein product [Fraxinus pennsylvanica]